MAEKKAQADPSLNDLLVRLPYDHAHKIREVFERELRERLAIAFGEAFDQLRLENEQLRSENVRLAHQLEERLITPRIDEKTGLLSGSYFNELIVQIIVGLCGENSRHRDRRYGSPCLVVGDIREMKVYNDHLGGHDVGDALLAAVGYTISRQLRSDVLHPTDWAARSNEKGDEVEILLTAPRTPIEAGQIVARIKDAFYQRDDWSEFHPNLNLKRPWVDFGAAALRGQSINGILTGLKANEVRERVNGIIQKWRKLADSKMYEAKQHRSDIFSFGWYDYVDGDLVDITDKMSETPWLEIGDDDTEA